MTKKSPPVAESVDREPSDEPNPKVQPVPVTPEDEPKGHPNSDRFHTEAATDPKTKP